MITSAITYGKQFYVGDCVLVVVTICIKLKTYVRVLEIWKIALYIPKGIKGFLFYLKRYKKCESG